MPNIITIGREHIPVEQIAYLSQCKYCAMQNLLTLYITFYYAFIFNYIFTLVRRQRGHPAQLSDSGREGPLQRRNCALRAPDGPSIVSEGHNGAGMAGEFRHEANLDALGLQRGDEAMPGTVRRNDG